MHPIPSTLTTTQGLGHPYCNTPSTFPLFPFSLQDSWHPTHSNSRGVDNDEWRRHHSWVAPFYFWKRFESGNKEPAQGYFRLKIYVPICRGLPTSLEFDKTVNFNWSPPLLPFRAAFEQLLFRGSCSTPLAPVLRKACVVRVDRVFPIGRIVPREASASLSKANRTGLATNEDIDICLFKAISVQSMPSPWKNVHQSNGSHGRQTRPDAKLK